MSNSDEIKVEVLKRTLYYITSMHHWTITGSHFHELENNKDFHKCKHVTCKNVTEILKNLEDGIFCLHPDSHSTESPDLRNNNRRDDRVTHWHCLICDDYFPLIGDSYCWLPKLMPSLNPVADDLAKEYPILWEKVVNAEREMRGLVTRDEGLELQQLMHEIWLARTNRLRENVS